MKKKVKPAHTTTSRPMVADSEPLSIQDGSTWQQAWDAFWYTSAPTDALLPIQRLVAVVCVLWFSGQLNALQFWWGPSGLGSTELSASLEAATEGAWASRFRWTPWWSFHASGAIQLWCVIGIGLAVLAGLNKGGRALRAVLALWVLMLCQRMTWASGLTEPWLVALTFYLILPRFDQPSHWCNGLAKRLIQVHVWLLLCAGLSNQLAQAAWWQGEAVWWMVADKHSFALNTEWLANKLLLVNFLTHSITLANVVVIVCLWPFRTQGSLTRDRVGIAAGVVYAIACIVFAGHVLFGLLLVAGVLAWRWPPSASMPRQTGV